MCLSDDPAKHIEIYWYHTGGYCMAFGCYPSLHYHPQHLLLLLLFVRLFGEESRLSWIESAVRWMWLRCDQPGSNQTCIALPVSTGLVSERKTYVSESLIVLLSWKRGRSEGSRQSQNA